MVAHTPTSQRYIVEHFSTDPIAKTPEIPQENVHYYYYGRVRRWPEPFGATFSLWQKAKVEGCRHTPLSSVTARGSGVVSGR